MFYKKKGLPEIGEIVICTVRRVLPDSIFVDLDEYEKEAMIHISEVAPGRIRNIRDFVKEDKKVVCKVLNINREKGYVDLSLRRVNQAQRITKNNEYKQEHKAEKILEEFGKKQKFDLKTVYEKIGYKIIEDFGTLTNCFNEIVNGKTDLKDLKADADLIKTLVNVVKEKIRPQEVEIVATIKFESDSGDAIDLIKKTLIPNKDNVQVTYLSAPLYRLKVTSHDYKKAEHLIKEMQTNIEEIAKKNKARFALVR